MGGIHSALYLDGRPYYILLTNVYFLYFIVLMYVFCSTLQGGFELPTRLSVAAADCIIALSVALTKKEMVSNASKDMKKLSKSSQQELGSQKKVKSISQTSEITKDMEMKLLLWNLVDHLIMLVQRLLAVCSQLFIFVFQLLIRWML